MALPTFALAGPFQGHAGRLVGADGLDGAGLATLASLYVALVTDVMLDLLGASGDVIVDGPLARNAVYASLLAALRPQPVLTSMARAGTLAGARRLVRGEAEPPPSLRAVVPADVPGLAAYRADWRARA
jgi:sugar (pentulose or hexulose) kinase